MMGNAMNFTRPLLCAGALVLISAQSASASAAYALTNVNLRAGPATTNEIVARIPGGSKIESTGCTDGWCAVDWNGKSGFVIQTAIDTSGRPPAHRVARVYHAGGEEYVGPEYAEGPPVYYAPAPYYGPPVVYYGGPYWRGGWGWGWGWHGGWRRY